MINYRRTCLAVLALLCLEMSVNMGAATAQTQAEIIGKAKVDSISQKTSVSVAIQPFFLLNNAVKIDLELQSANSKFGYIFSIEGYGGSMQEDRYKYTSRDPVYDKLNGIGIGIAQKFRFIDDRPGPYIAYGLTYRYQEIAIETEGFFPYQENGFTYYDYGPLEKNLVISSGLASAVFGYQKVKDNFVYDFYFGIGYKAQLKDTGFDGLREYNQYQYSYAYKGSLMMLGFKMGFQLR